MQNQLELLNCKPAPRKPQEPIARGATIDGNYRFDLTRSWGAGPPICWIMLNPSRADTNRDDPTVWNIMCRSLLWGFGSLVVVNIYPYITSDPKVMKRWRAGGRCGHIYDNANRAMTHIRGCQMTVAAWGAHADPDDVDYIISRPEFCPADFGPEPIILHCLGRTKDGAPLHPLARGKHFIPMDRKPIPFTWEPPEDHH